MARLRDGQLVAAARAGRVLDCSRDGLTRSLDARVIRSVLTTSAGEVDPRGLHIAGALIEGVLDLAGVHVPFPISFSGCTFSDALMLDGCAAAGLSIKDSRLPGLLANGMTLARDLVLSGSTINGAHTTMASTSRKAAVWLCEATIGGRLHCVDSVLIAPDGRALQADNMRVAGAVRLLHGFTSYGQIRLLGAQIGGALDMTGAHVYVDPPELAMNFSEINIGGSLFLIASLAGRRPTVHGAIDIGGGHIAGELLCRGLTLSLLPGPPPPPGIGKGNAADASVPIDSPAQHSGSQTRLRDGVTGDQRPDDDSPTTDWPAAGTNVDYVSARRTGWVLSGPRLTVDGDVTFEGECRTHGGIDLSLAELGDLWIDGRARFIAADAKALDLTGAQLHGSLTCARGFEAKGRLGLVRAHIHGNLVLRETYWSDAPRPAALEAQGLALDGDLDCRAIRVSDGSVVFRSATLGGIVDFENAHLSNPDGYSALNLHRAIVRGSIRLVDGFHALGLVMLGRSTVDGRVDLRGGTFDPPADQSCSRHNLNRDAVHAMSATIRGGLSMIHARFNGGIDLSGATTSVLDDDPSGWPHRFVIAGFTYNRFADPRETSDATPAVDPWDWRARCVWLERQHRYDSTGYEQVAQVFRQHGFVEEAESVLIAQRRQARRDAHERRRDAAPLTRVSGHLGDLWDFLLRILVGYGYRPTRVIWILAALTALVGATLHLPLATNVMRTADPQGIPYSIHGPIQPRDTTTQTTSIDACGNGAVRCFDAELFAIDTVIPLVSLGQRSTWYPDEDHRGGVLLTWWLNLATMLGWLLSSVFALSLARFARNT